MPRQHSQEHPQMSVEDTITSYRDEWVLMNLRSPVNTELLAARGAVLFHSKDHDNASRAAIFFNKKRNEFPSAPNFLLFHALPLARTGDEVRAFLSEATSKGIIGGFERW
jgi:hypothetical protein